MKHGSLIRSFAVMLLALGMAGSPAFADSIPDNWDAEAIKVLKQMDVYTNSLEKFVIKAESYLDASIGEGLTYLHTCLIKKATCKGGLFGFAIDTEANQ